MTRPRVELAARESSEGDVLDKMAYTLSNPTVAGLVKSPEQWPGQVSRRFGEQRDVEMPDLFFDDEARLPDEATLEISRPRIFSGLSDSDLQAKLCDAVAMRVKRARDDLQQRGQSFAGRDAVLRQSFSATPKTPAPRRNPSPNIAAKNTGARVRAIERLLGFRKAYRAALVRWRCGDVRVVFPTGTYALRLLAGVACEPP